MYLNKWCNSLCQFCCKIYLKRKQTERSKPLRCFYFYFIYIMVVQYNTVSVICFRDERSPRMQEGLTANQDRFQFSQFTTCSLFILLYLLSAQPKEASVCTVAFLLLLVCEQTQIPFSKSKDQLCPKQLNGKKCIWIVYFLSPPPGVAWQYASLPGLGLES